MADNQCAVCLSDQAVRPAALDGCEHRFCRDCVLEWSRVTNLCPVCRRAFSAISCHGPPDELIPVAERRQQVRYEDTGMALVDPLLLPQPRLRLTRQNAFVHRTRQPEDFLSSLLSDWEDPVERGFSAYQRQSLQRRLLDSVYGRLNGEGRRRPRASRPNEVPLIDVTRDTERPRRRRRLSPAVIVLSDSEDEGSAAQTSHRRSSAAAFRLEYACAQSP